MNVNLMFKNSDFTRALSPEGELIIPEFSKSLIDDLELSNIISVMAGNDDLISSVCTQAILSPLQNIDDIKYRQEIIQDCINHSDLIRQLYDICTDTEEKQRYSRYNLSSNWISGTFSSAVGLLHIYFDHLKEIRTIADKNIKDFHSEGFKAFFSMIQKELSNNYLSDVDKLFTQLDEGEGILISAKFGSYLQGVEYTFRRKESSAKPAWWFAPSYSIPERNNASADDLGLRRDRAINQSTDTLAKAAENIGLFITQLKTELAFYVGTVNLYNFQKKLNAPICFPVLTECSSFTRSWHNLYDGSLAILKNTAVVGNDYSSKNSDNKMLYIITGANQGGKTTFIRSIGQAQLMAQSGLFVFASEFTVPIRTAIFSHFKKEEDNSMNSGKLDEEMVRLNCIVEEIVTKKTATAGTTAPASPSETATAEGVGDNGDSEVTVNKKTGKIYPLILFNEAFASTNEREGSEIFEQITQALIENNVEIFSVSHLYAYASAYIGKKYALFLRAEHFENGERSFKITEGEPLATAFGEELYKKIFID